MKDNIELGDTVEDIYCKFVGVAVSRTKFVNGCIQYGVVAKVKKGEAPTEIAIDSDSLIVVKKAKNSEDSDGNNGGAMRKAPKQGGYGR